MAIPVQKLGWMGAVIDLRGHLIEKKNQKRATPQYVLMAESKEIAVVRELSSLTGTRVELQASRPLKEFMKRACSEHCPESHVHVGDDRTMPRIARWTITGASMATVLDNLLPYMVIDRGYEQVVEEIFESTVLVGQGSGMVRASLARLRELGWELPPHFEQAVKNMEVDLDGVPGNGSSY